MRRAFEAGRRLARLRHSPSCTTPCLRGRALVVIRSLALSAPLLLIAAGASASEPLTAEVASNLFVDRARTLSLEHVREAFRTGRIDEGIRQIQELLDAPHDSFVRSRASQQSVREAAQTILAEAPIAVRRQYAASQEARAAAKTSRAIAAGDIDDLGDVVRRYPGTESARTAADRLARVTFDRGDFGVAARIWKGLLAEGPATQVATKQLAMKTIVALQRSGDEAAASELLQFYRLTPLPHTSQPAERGSLLLQGTSPPKTPLTDQYASQLTPPAFPPLWHHTARNAGDVLEDFWTSSRVASGRLVATPASGVIADGTLFVREPAALVAYDLKTGAATEVASLTNMPASAPSGETEYVETGRSTHDLHELSRFEDQFAGNGVLTSLSHDGERLYVVERSSGEASPIRTASQTTIPEFRPRGAGDRANQLTAVAIPTAVTTDRRLWTTGGNSPSRSELASHYFFGPPVASQGWLLAITEERQCLHLVVLDPVTGDLLWQQPLGFVPRPVDDDASRASTRNQPAVANGIAVCQSNAGFVVAVDIVTRQLLWAYEYGDASLARSERRNAHETPSSPGDPSLPSGVLIRRDQVLLLPQDSDRVICLDLATGQCRWSVPRDDALSLVALTDSAALLLGRTSVRALSPIDGHTRWTTRVGAVSGTGIVTDSAYLVPLDAGTVAALDLATGRKIGFDRARDSSDFSAIDTTHDEPSSGTAWRPGNLVTDGKAIYSIEPFGITCLNSAAAAIAESAAEPGSIEMARLELAAGNLDAAQSTLESLRTAQDAAATSRQATRLLQELHYLRLAGETGDEKQVALAALDELTAGPADRARYLLHATFETDNVTPALQSRRMVELAELDFPTPLPAPDDATHFVTAASWLPTIAGSRPQRETFPSEANAIADLDDDELRARLLCAFDENQAAELRLELAGRAIRDSEFHQAELLLLRAAESDQVAVRANREIASLRRRCGFVADDPSDHEQPAGAISQVRITGELWSPADPGLCETYQQTRRGFISRGQNPFRVVDLGDNRNARLAVVDLQRGLRLGEMSIDARLRFPSPTRQPRDSHFVPIVTADRLYGLSYLEAANGRPAWETRLPDSHFLPQIGPYGTTFCSVQSHAELRVLDPANGQTLWRRTELPVPRSAQANQAAELFGDDRALTLLSPDGTTYTVFETPTGRLIDRGRLPISSLRQRRVLGRKLFFVENRDDRAIARLWDPLPDQPNLEIPFEGGLLEAATRDDHLVLLTGDGRLTIIDSDQARVVAQLPIGPIAAGQVRSLQAFSDDERYYVSLFTGEPLPSNSTRIMSYVYDTPLAMAHVQGHLIAIDRESGRLAWSRPTEQRSILDPADHAFPCLVALVRQSDRQARSRKTLLVEAIDPRTGAVLGRNTALMPDQLLQVRYDANDDRITLAGMTSSVVLDIEREGSERAIVSTSPGAP